MFSAFGFTKAFSLGKKFKSHISLSIFDEKISNSIRIHPTNWKWKPALRVGQVFTHPISTVLSTEHARASFPRRWDSLSLNRDMNEPLHCISDVHVHIFQPIYAYAYYKIQGILVEACCWPCWHITTLGPNAVVCREILLSYSSSCKTQHRLSEAWAEYSAPGTEFRMFDLDFKTNVLVEKRGVCWHYKCIPLGPLRGCFLWLLCEYMK